MKWCVLLITIFLVGCNTNYQVMTRKGFDEVDVGMTSRVIEQRFGNPYKIYSKGGEVEIYEYIERIPIGTQVFEQRRYYIVIEKGRVVSKHTKLSNPPSFDEIYSDDPFPN